MEGQTPRTNCKNSEKRGFVPLNTTGSVNFERESTSIKHWTLLSRLERHGSSEYILEPAAAHRAQHCIVAYYVSYRLNPTPVPELWTLQQVRSDQRQQTFTRHKADIFMCASPLCKTNCEPMHQPLVSKALEKLAASLTRERHAVSSIYFQAADFIGTKAYRCPRNAGRLY